MDHEYPFHSRYRGSNLFGLTKIYGEDVRQIEEAVRVSRKSPQPVTRPRVSAVDYAPEPPRRHYAQATADHFRYDLFSESETHPQLERFVAPYYPSELAEEKLSGEVIVD